MRAVAAKIYTKKERNSILFLPCLPETAASARHRIYKYLPYFEKSEFRYTLAPPTSIKTLMEGLFSKKPLGNYRYFISVFLNRLSHLWKAPRYDIVFVQRDILSEFFLDPPLAIHLLKLLNRNIIFDVDDALFMLPPHSSRAASKTLNMLARWRFAANCRCAKSVIVGNPYLADRAKRYNDRVYVIPTLIDVENYPIRDHKKRDRVTIGWVGGAGNLPYLRMVEAPLAELSKKYPVVLRVVSSRGIELTGVPTEFFPWRLETESSAMSEFDIGIMPLPDNDYTRGKCGFKILQYMASGVPSVASRVGENASILQGEEAGFLAETQEQWANYLSKLIEDRQLRQRVGRNGRKTVEERYSYGVWAERFIQVIRETAS